MNTSKIFLLYVICCMKLLRVFGWRRNHQASTTTSEEKSYNVTLMRTVDSDTGVDCVVAVRRNNQKVVFTIGSFENPAACKQLINDHVSLRKTQNGESHFLVKRSSQRLARLGSKISLRCHDRRPQTKVLWYKNDASKELQVKKLDHLKSNGRGNTLTFLSFSDEDVGSYSCRVSDQSLPSNTINVRAMQCRADEASCDDSKCFNNGVCCEKKQNPSDWRCMCIGTRTGMRCNENVLQATNGSMRNEDAVQGTLIAGLSCLMLLCIALAVGIVCMSRKDKRSESKQSLNCNCNDEECIAE